jgi:hypothetical protein
VTKKQTTIPGASSLPPWLNSQTWEAFLSQRTKKRAANTDYSLGLILRKLDGFRAAGHDPNFVLDQSIEFGWVGVFEPRGPARVFAVQQSFRERDQAQREDRASRWVGKGPDNVVEMPNATARLK